MRIARGHSCLTWPDLPGPICVEALRFDAIGFGRLPTLNADP